MTRNDGRFDEVDNPGRKEQRNPRLPRAAYMPFRTDYILGADLDDLARTFMAEHGIDTLDNAKRMLRLRRSAENWDYLRDRHAEFLANRKLEEADATELARFNQLLKSGASFLVEAGMAALVTMAPATVTEAVLMLREGREMGYRALGEPDRLTRQEVNLGGSLAVDHHHAHDLQNVSPDEFATLARAGLAALTASLDGPATPPGRGDPGGTEG
jgi:hypothetical protein